MLNTANSNDVAASTDKNSKTYIRYVKVWKNNT